MDEQINEKLDALLKYIPFIDFIVERDKEQYVKFIEIRKWIINKKRYNLNDLNKIQKSIITQYKNLIEVDDKNIPLEIMQIFVDEFKHQYVNLCSDDEDNTIENNFSKKSDASLEVNIESENDIEIVSISYPEKQKRASNSSSIQKSERFSPLPKENVCGVIDALDEPSAELLRHIDQFSKEESKYADPHNYHENSDNDEKLFQERIPSLFTRREKNCEIESKRNCSTVSPSIVVDTISLDSSDDEMTNPAAANDKRRDKLVENNSIIAGSNDNNKICIETDWEILLTRRSQDKNPASKNTMDGGITEECNLNNLLEKMNHSKHSAENATSVEKPCEEQSNPCSSNSTDTCVDINEANSNGNIEKLLLKIIKKLLSTSPREQSPVKTTSTGDNNTNISREMSPVQVASPQFTRAVDQHHQYIVYPDMASQRAPMYHHQYDYQNSAPQHNDFHFTPIQALPNQRKLNLKDPRIRNWLNIYKNSPLLTASERDMAANLGNTITLADGINQPYTRSAVICQPPAYILPPGDAISAPHCQTKYMAQPLAQNCRMPHTTQTTIQKNSGTSSTKSRMTYGEYKRRKAEEQMRAEKQRDTERKQQENSLTLKVHGNIDNGHDIKKKGDEIRSVLIKTLQPNAKKIESVMEVHTNPVNEATNDKNEPKPPHSGENIRNVVDIGRNKPQDPIHVGGDKKNNTTNTIAEKGISNRVHVEDETPNKTELEKEKQSTEEQESSRRTTNKENVKNGKTKKDFKCSIPKAIGVKRRASIHASSAIACQLNPNHSSLAGIEFSPFQTTKHSTESRTPKRRKTVDDVPKSSVRKRRSSVHARASIAGELNSNKLKPTSPPCSYTSIRREDTIGELTKLKTKNSDSELSNFETNHLAKIQKSKETIVKKQAKIVLKRLTDNEIDNFTKRHEKVKPDNKSRNVLNVVLVESKSQPVNKFAAKKSSVSKKTAPKRLNNDCQMTESNTRCCALCSSRPSDLTNHYVGKHKTESYISRLTWSQLDDLSINIPFAKVLPSTNSRVLRYAVVCPFCDETLEGPFMSLYNHYSTHTGEYAFQCSGCQLKKPFRADIQSHQLHSKTCRSGHVQTMYRYPSTMAIYLHYCCICNFVQLNEANIFKHLREHHDLRQDSPNNVEKCVLTAISDGPDASTEPENPKDLNQQIHSHSNENTEEVGQTIQNEVTFGIPIKNEFELDDNIPVRNEACSEEILDSTLCTLEEELKRMHEGATVETTIPMTVVHFDPSGNIGSATTPSKHETIHVQCKSEFIDSDDKCLITPSNPSFKNTTVHPHSSSRSTYRSFPFNVKYLGLYKCMSDDCYYSSDSSNELLNHLEDHRREHASDEYLQCAYCNILQGTHISPQQLVDHIGEKHLHMIYQCSLCCYRSCEASNVSVHQKENHSQTYEECKVYKGYGEHRLYNEQYVYEKIAENVRKLQCQYCSQKSFYHSNLLVDHIQTDHKIHVRDSIVNYSCIYCPFTDKDESLLRKHLALMHPDELPYVCRHNNSVLEIEDLLHNLQPYYLGQPMPVVEINDTLDGVAVEKPERPVEDVKPNMQELLRCHEETVKVQLRKLTEQTGVSPDILYHCPEQSCSGFFSIYDLWLRHMRVKHHCLECQCPHCPKQTKRSLEDYKVHFEEHRRHTYICFHCPLTFSNYENAIDHASRCHVALGPMRFEQIRFNLSYSYFVMIQIEMLTSRSELIPALLNSLGRNLKELEHKKSMNLKHSWLVSSDSTTWLDDYSADISCGTFFICAACCSHYYCRLQLTNHITEEHSARDVVIVNVIRSSHGTTFGLGVVFANERMSFSTMRNCFCCAERNMKGDSLILHLKRYHKFSISYFCEWCNSPIESLQVAEKHFELVHDRKKLKIRCEFASKSDISIMSVRYFKVHIDSGNENERKSQLAMVKQEPTDDPTNDDSVILLEEDDIVLEKYVKEREIIEMNSEKPKIMCIAERLMKPTRNPSSSPSQVVAGHNTHPIPRFKIVHARQHKAPIESSFPSSSAKVLEKCVKEREIIEMNSEKPKIMCIATERLMKPTRNPSSSPAQVIAGDNTHPIPRFKIVQGRQHKAPIESSFPSSSSNLPSVPRSNELTTPSTLNSGFFRQQVTAAPSAITSNVSTTPSKAVPTPFNFYQSNQLLPEYSSNERDYLTSTAIFTELQESSSQQSSVTAIGNIIESRNSMSPNRIKQYCSNRPFVYRSSTIATCFLNSQESGQANTIKEV